MVPLYPDVLITKALARIRSPMEGRETRLAHNSSRECETAASAPE